MRKHALFILLAAVLAWSSLVFSQNRRGPSTAAERIRAEVLAEHLEADPLNPAYREDFAWLVDWVGEIPDINVQVCPANMPFSKTYKRAPELTGVVLAASVAYITQHPDKANDPAAVGLAALESTIRAYKKILKQERWSRSKEMDAVIKIQKDGKLADYLNERWKTMCK